MRELHSKMSHRQLKMQTHKERRYMFPSLTKWLIGFTQWEMMHLDLFGMKLPIFL